MSKNILEQQQAEQRVQVLQFQNSRLIEQLESQREQIASLEKQAQEFEQGRQQYAQTLLCVNRLWGQLNDDVADMLLRATGEQPPCAEGADAAGTAAAAADAAASGSGGGRGRQRSSDGGGDAAIVACDPFLGRLLSGADAAALKQAASAHKQLTEEASEVEIALQLRMARTMEALAALLPRLPAVPPAAAAAAPSSGGSGSAAAAAAGAYSAHAAALREAVTAAAVAPDAALLADNERLAQEATVLEAQLRAVRGQQRAGQQLLKQTEDRLFECEETLKSIKNDLADKDMELGLARRKVAALKGQQGQPARGSAGGGGLAPSSGGGAVAAELGSVGGVGVGGGEDTSELRARVHELQQLLDKRSAELQREAEETARLQRQVLEAQAARNQDESWVLQSATYAAVRREAAAYLADLEHRTKEAEALGRERDELLRRLDGQVKQQEVEKVMRTRLEASQRQLEALQATQVQLLQDKHELQRQMQMQREAYGDKRTVQELQLMAATLQSEAELAKRHVKDNKVSAERVADARTQVADALAAAAERDADLARLRNKLRAHAGEAAAAAAREAALRERAADLRAFVEVVTLVAPEAVAAAGGAGGGAALRTARLEAEVADLQRQLEGHGLQAKLQEAAAAQAALQAKLDDAHKASDKLALEAAALRRQVAEAGQQVAQLRAENESYLAEIEQANEQYEEMQSQNTRLLQTMLEKDEAAGALVAERLRLSQAHERLLADLEAARAEVARLGADVAAAAAQRAATDKEMAKLTAELAAAREQTRSTAARADALGRELAGRDAAAASMAAQLEAAARDKAAQARQGDEVAEALGRERSKRQRLEEEVELLERRLERARCSQETTDAVQDLEEEVAAMRTLLKCNVCRERQKSVIITKCWHMFCQPCIKRNLDTRHRKCPGCGVAFGQADVKQFFFT